MGLLCLYSCFQYVKSMINWLDWLLHLGRFSFFELRSSRAGLALIVYVYCEVLSYRFCNFWLNLSRTGRNSLFLLAVTSLINTSYSVPLVVIHARDHHTSEIMWNALDHKPCSMFFPSLWSRSWCHLFKESCFQIWTGFLAKSNLIFLLLCVSTGLHLG